MRHASTFIHVTHAHAHADNAPLGPYARVYTRACYGVVQCLPMKSPTITVGIYGERKTIAWCPCTPPSTVEKFGGGDDDDDETKIEKLHMSGFSRGKPEAGRNELGLCTARYESKSCC